MKQSEIYMVAALALVIGYAGYTGDGIKYIGLHGVQTRVDSVKGIKSALDSLQAKIDTAKRDLAKESPEAVKKQVEAYRASLSLLRALVPDQREVANLIDDISIRAKRRGVSLTNFSPQVPVPGPAPFDTYSYQWTVVGRYHNVGEFLTDIASLRRIMVPGDISIAGANMTTARALGDTTAMLEAHITIRTYVKAKAPEDAPHGK